MDKSITIDNLIDRGYKMHIIKDIVSPEMIYSILDKITRKSIFDIVNRTIIDEHTYILIFKLDGSVYTMIYNYDSDKLHVTDSYIKEGSSSKLEFIANLIDSKLTKEIGLLHHISNGLSIGQLLRKNGKLSVI